MQRIVAQVSLYPLRQTALSAPIHDLLSVLRSRGLEVRLGEMSTLVIGEPGGEPGVLFDALGEAFREAAERGHVVMVATFSNACPLDSE